MLEPDEERPSRPHPTTPTAPERSASRLDGDEVREAVRGMQLDELKAFTAAMRGGQEDAAADVASRARVRREREIERQAVGATVHAPSALEDRFNVARHLTSTEYLFRDGKGVAFRETRFRLESPTDALTAINGMLDRVSERGWTAIRVSGSPEFRRQTWIHAEARGIRALGYQPTVRDLAAVRDQRRRDRSSGPKLQQATTIATPSRNEQAEAAIRRQQEATSVAQRHPDVMQALERAFLLRQVPPEAQQKIRDAVIDGLSVRIAQRQTVRAMVNDPTPDAPAPARTGPRREQSMAR